MDKVMSYLNSIISISSLRQRRNNEGWTIFWWTTKDILDQLGVVSNGREKTSNVLKLRNKWSKNNNKIEKNYFPTWQSDVVEQEVSVDGAWSGCGATWSALDESESDELTGSVRLEAVPELAAEPDSDSREMAIDNSPVKTFVDRKWERMRFTSTVWKWKKCMPCARDGNKAKTSFTDSVTRRKLKKLIRFYQVLNKKRQRMSDKYKYNSALEPAAVRPEIVFPEFENSDVEIRSLKNTTYELIDKNENGNVEVESKTKNWELEAKLKVLDSPEAVHKYLDELLGHRSTSSKASSPFDVFPIKSTTTES